MKKDIWKQINEESQSVKESNKKSFIHSLSYSSFKTNIVTDLVKQIVTSSDFSRTNMYIDRTVTQSTRETTNQINKQIRIHSSHHQFASLPSSFFLSLHYTDPVRLLSLIISNIPSIILFPYPFVNLSLPLSLIPSPFLSSSSPHIVFPTLFPMSSPIYLSPHPVHSPHSISHSFSHPFSCLSFLAPFLCISIQAVIYVNYVEFLRVFRYSYIYFVWLFRYISHSISA